MQKTWALGIAAASLLVVGGVTQVACSSSSATGTDTGDSGSTTDGSASHPDGGTEAGDSGSDTGNGACATVCAASDCANPPHNPQPNDSCDKCISASFEDGGACQAPVYGACNSNPDCVALLTCLHGTSSGGGCPADGGLAGLAPDGSTDMQCQAYNEDACNNCCSLNHESGVTTFNGALVNCECGH